MSRPTTSTVRGWIGLSVIDPNGQDVGRVVRAYADDETGAAEWLAVDVVGTSTTHLVPTLEARAEAQQVHITFTSDLVASSPATGSPATVSVDEEAELYRHYDVPTPAEEQADPELGGGTQTDAAAAAPPRRRLVRLVQTDDDASAPLSAASAGAASGTGSPSDTAGLSSDDAAPPASVLDAPATSSDTTPAPAAAPAPEQSSSRSKGLVKALPAAGLALAAGTAGVLLRRRAKRQKQLAQQRKAGLGGTLVLPALAVIALLARRLRKRKSTSAPAPITIDQSKAPVLSTTATAALPDDTATTPPVDTTTTPVDTTAPLGGTTLGSDDSLGTPLTGTTGTTGLDDFGTPSDTSSGSASGTSSGFSSGSGDVLGSPLSAGMSGEPATTALPDDPAPVVLPDDDVTRGTDGGASRPV